MNFFQFQQLLCKTLELVSKYTAREYINNLFKSINSTSNAMTFELIKNVFTINDIVTIIVSHALKKMFLWPIFCNNQCESIEICSV